MFILSRTSLYGYSLILSNAISSDKITIVHFLWFTFLSSDVAALSVPHLEHVIFTRIAA